MASSDTILVLGLGNTLLSDDGVGLHVLDALRQRGLELGEGARVRLQDGGTLGLTLLPDIEDADALIVVDAAMIGGAPGAVDVFEGEAMDRQLAGRKTSVHEVALSDLVDAARLVGRLPERRALVGIQPATTEWGLAPSPVVAAAVPRACTAIEDIVDRWRT